MKTDNLENFFWCDYNLIEKLIYNYEKQLQAAKIDAICALMRGGMIPAFIAAQILDTRKIFFAEYDRPNRKVKIINAPQDAKRVLLTEDMSGAGFTTPDVKAALEELGYEVLLLTILVDDRSRIQPDFGFQIGPGNCFFPWDRHRYSPKLIKTFEEEGYVRSEPGDRFYMSGAVDLDGVLLPDVHADEYRNDLEAALARRAALIPFDKDFFPKVPNEVFSIVTGRPEEDRADTERWLAEHGITFEKLIMRDDAKYPVDAKFTHKENVEMFARYKADMLLTEGITHFYESDLWQAVMISNFLPMLRVFVWNNDMELRYEISGRKA